MFKVKNRWQFALIMLLFELNWAHQAASQETWTYTQTKDAASNQIVSVARSPVPRLDLYDKLRLEAVCKDNKLQMVVDSDILIASQGSEFDFEFQIDQLEFQKIKMRTYPDSKRRAFNEANARSFAEALASGSNGFIRFNTMIRRLLSASISLQGASEAIQRVFNDCGQSLNNKSPNYTFEDFSREYHQLPPEVQQRILQKLRVLMPGKQE